VPPAQTVHVGDLEETDVAGAREAGLRSVLITNGRDAPDTAADTAIGALDELIDVIETWEHAA